MKLKNKKTGEIVPASNIAVGIGKDGKWFNSLAELNEEWEDYEEPKCYWYVNDLNGKPLQAECSHYAGGEEYYEKSIETRKQIGNYFETKEEAERAVEQLKAWKRLKDCGAKFVGWVYSEDTNADLNGLEFYGDDVIIGLGNANNVRTTDIDLLFGGKE